MLRIGVSCLRGVGRGEPFRFDLPSRTATKCCGVEKLGQDWAGDEMRSVLKCDVMASSDGMMRSGPTWAGDEQCAFLI